MRIEVRAHPGRFDDQTRAYAEYRVFSSLAPLSDSVRSATITLALEEPGGGRTRSGLVVCTVAIAGDTGFSAEVSARGRHPCEAVDRAARRASRLRFPQPAL